MNICSRIHDISAKGFKIDTGDGNEWTDIMVPFADMFNHKQPKMSSWTYSYERKGFCIEACEDIPKGEQIFQYYGSKCNSVFFLSYGFINLDNDANKV